MSVNPDLHRRRLTGAVTALAGLGVAGWTPRLLSENADPDGTLQRIPGLSSTGIAPRDVEVWLPPGFDPDTRHAVLYMHDGQMLFDPTRTWNKKAWEMDRTATRLLKENAVQNFLIVGIANDATRRHAEFFPQAALADLEPASLRAGFIDRALGGRPAADNYLKFIVEVVKPLVDARYPTLTDRDSTFIMGSSMGGLISLYAVCEYPEVFGGAAALSTHWIGTFDRNTEIPTALIRYLSRKLPTPENTKLYMDRGTLDLDARYDEAQTRVDQMMDERGFSTPRFVTRVYPNAGHDETAWAARVATPLQFLLGRG